jgi:hypothetical protein
LEVLILKLFKHVEEGTTSELSLIFLTTLRGKTSAKHSRALRAHKTSQNSASGAKDHKTFFYTSLYAIASISLYLRCF